MAGQSAGLTLKESKAMQDSIQHPCSQARSGGSHDHETKSSDNGMHPKKKGKSESHTIHDHQGENY